MARLLGWTLLAVAALLTVLPIVVLTTGSGGVLDPRAWYGSLVVVTLLGASLLARDGLGRPRAVWRGLLLLLAGIACVTLGGISTTSDEDEITTIGVRVLAILFAMIGAYQLVLGLMAARHEQ